MRVGLTDAHVLGHKVDALNDDAVLLCVDTDDTTLLTAVSAASLARSADDLNQVTLLDVRHD
jgi:arginine repressor